MNKVTNNVNNNMKWSEHPNLRENPSKNIIGKKYISLYKERVHVVSANSFTIIVERM